MKLKKIPHEAYQALEDIVGKDYVTEDPSITQAYSRCETGMPIEKRPEAVILPDSTEQIQAIYRLANQHKFCVIPIGTMLIISCVPFERNKLYVTVDPKRMNHFQIDERNMFAVVEPYVTFGQLQVEAMKRGLDCYISGAGCQISVLANLVFQGAGIHGYRLGMGNRSMLAMEWVLPNGELLRTGSLTVPNAGFFWGEGPGPDFRGVLKGIWGFAGGIGMCTRIAIKLFPWHGPKTLPMEGISPEKICKLPPDQFKFFILSYPSFEKAIEAIYQIGRAEIAGKCTFWASTWFIFLTALSQEELFRLTRSNIYLDALSRSVVVLLEAHTSKKQLAYEEKILRDIVAETGGHFLPDDINQWYSDRISAELVRTNLISRLWRATGRFTPLKIGGDSLDHAIEIHKSTLEKVKKFVQSEKLVMNCEGEGMWINPYDLCHSGHAESALASDGDNGMFVAGKLALECFYDDIQHERHTLLGSLEPLLQETGRVMGNFHLIVKEVLKAFDPNNISNPPWPINTEKEDEEV